MVFVSVLRSLQTKFKSKGIFEDLFGVEMGGERLHRGLDASRISVDASRASSVKQLEPTSRLNASRTSSEPFCFEEPRLDVSNPCLDASRILRSTDFSSTELPIFPLFLLPLYKTHFPKTLGPKLRFLGKKE